MVFVLTWFRKRWDHSNFGVPVFLVVLLAIADTILYILLGFGIYHFIKDATDVEEGETYFLPEIIFGPLIVAESICKYTGLADNVEQKFT